MKKIILLSSLVTITMLSNLNAFEFVLPDILNPNIKSKQEMININNFKRVGPTIQVAILLDTSNSMDGLIEQTKQQIWTIINELSKANKNNLNATIQIGLFEYGKASIPQEEGFLQMLAPLTNDLDLISEKLFSLRTNGGSEYAGKVILESVNRMAWSNHKDDLKLIIIAGNESFQQGDIDFNYSINKANNNNIIINTIFCGNYNQGIQLKWKDAAVKGNGKYMNISQNDDIVIYHTKYDDEINNLGNQLNSTYINYGIEGLKKKNLQLKQDRMADNLSSVTLTERNIAKSSKSYNASSWDAVSIALENKEVATKMLKNEIQFKKKSDEEIKQILDDKLKERNIIQTKIFKLEKLRSEDIKKQK